MAGAKERVARRAMLAAILLSLPVPHALAQDYMLPEPVLKPPSRPEIIPPSPGRSYEWAPGRWKWTGQRFTWARGRYIQRRPWTYRWVKGHFVGTGDSQKFVPGHFGGPKRTNIRSP